MNLSKLYYFKVIEYRFEIVVLYLLCQTLSLFRRIVIVAMLILFISRLSIHRCLTCSLTSNIWHSLTIFLSLRLYPLYQTAAPGSLEADGRNY